MKKEIYLSGFLLFGVLTGCGTSKKATGEVMSVRGAISKVDLGTTLVHEHLTTDFIGAEKVLQPQYEQALAVKTILPHLKRLQQAGIATLVECTPNHIGRDVQLLKTLSEASGLNIITNTGYYAAVDRKYLPQHVYEEDAATIAERWEKEWKKGIDGTTIRPGFIKLGVGKGELDEIEEKLLVAGIMLSKNSGLPIYIHTGDGEAAQSEYGIITREGLEPDRMIWVHAQNGTDEDRLDLAQKGIWISLDGVSETRVDHYVEMIKVMKENRLLPQLLLSHDDGWSVENKEGEISLKLFGNGNTVPYATIFEKLVPALQTAGFTQAELDQLLIENPKKALAIRPESAKKKVLDTGGFEIRVPAHWQYKPERGIDSFVGRIVGRGVDLSFDMSEMGYANSLTPEGAEKYQIELDTVGSYRRKLIQPENGEEGIIGIYLEDLRSTFNFNLSGYNLSIENQEKAMEAFKTIKIKRD